MLIYADDTSLFKTIRRSRRIEKLADSYIYSRFSSRNFFQGGGGANCYANFFCYANFSVVFGPNFGEGELLEGEAPPSPLPVEVSQIKFCKLLRCSK